MMILISTVMAFAYNPTWKELSDPDNWRYSHSTETTVGEVRVYKKQVDSFPCFRGQVTTTVDPKQLIEVAADVESAVQWSSASITQAKELLRTKIFVDYYQYIDIPFPLSDRYWFLRGYTEQNKDTLLFRWEKLDKGGEHADFYQEFQQKYSSAEETTINIGAWIVSPKGDQSVVQYLICTHPGGSVPDVFRSVGTEQTLPNNIADLIIETNRRK